MAPGSLRRCAAGQLAMALAAGAIDYLPVMFIGLRPPALTPSLSRLGALVLGWVGFNSVYMQGMTSQSLGKRLVGIRPGYRRDLAARGPPSAGGARPGPVRLGGSSPICWTCCSSSRSVIGLLRPLWQRESRPSPTLYATPW